MTHFERTRDPYTVTTDPDRRDDDAVHAYLSRSYWAREIPRETVVKGNANSLCFSLLDGSRQIGFARIVTDRTTFAYLCDVYVLEEYRSRGLARWMMEAVMTHPDLQGLRRFMLVTRDAHALYAPLGFETVQDASGHMEIVRKNPYVKP